MPYFRVKGKTAESGKARNRQYLAKSASQAQSQAEKDGIIVNSVEEIAEQPATERQLAYAADLGIVIPDGVSKDEISDLISLSTSDDSPSTDRHRAFAEGFGLEPTQYIGKKVLFDGIWNTLKQPERQSEMLQWFTFRVYLQLVNGSVGAPIDSPFDPVILEVAQELAKDEKAVGSIKRYEGRSLIRFGEWTTPDGSTHSGGSTRTIGFKEASRILSARLGIGDTSRPIDLPRLKQKTNLIGQQAEPGGCAGIAAIAFMLPASLLVYLLRQ
jgi:hypothetical protein